MPRYQRVMSFDVQVVGAGPAGLMAAEVLARGGARVRLRDHKDRPGRKFLLAGRGGLNITHSEPLEQFLTRYGEGRAALEPAIRAFPPEALRDWCHGLGIETFVGSSGRIFPKQMKASPLLRAWLRRLEGLGVVFEPRAPWAGFSNTPTLLALGGASWPELGSDGGWQSAFAEAGIAIAPLQPSNGRVRLAWTAHMTERFAGAPLKNIALSVDGRKVRGEAIISREGLEGGAIYALSAHLRQGPADMLIDLKPDLTQETVAVRLAEPAAGQSFSNILRKRFNLSPQAIALMREAGSRDPKRVMLKSLGPSDIRRAISTAGGVRFDELTPHFQLRRRPGTWLAGEMLDWDAPTGGYLLQGCFSTACWAAADMLNTLSGKENSRHNRRPQNSTS
ncbi:MAG: TIGR03862 family flavoprotein [Hyphomicrobiales bacterium]